MSRPRAAHAWCDRVLWRPVDIASLAVFRMLFGGVMLWECLRYFGHGWIRRFYIEPDFFFKYYGFGWVHPWPGNGMYFHFGALSVLAVLIMVGLCYRLSAALFLVGFTYVFLLDQSIYLNHFYLLVLVSFLMTLVPAADALSLDARWGLARPSQVAPAWALWVLRAQVGLVYFYGGIAKLNSDWLRGEPMRQWLSARTTLPVVGPFMDDAWLLWVFIYGGLLLDLLVTPGLLWRRTRPWAFGLAVLFHLTNAVIFKIGIFPWFMIAATALFLAPSWPRSWLPLSSQATGREAPSRLLQVPSGRRRRTIVAVLSAYLALQVLMPLRHWLYPGNVSWTEEGHRFSWRMKLRDKTGETQFLVTDLTSQQTRTVHPAQYLSRTQHNEMCTRPDMILQFAHHLARRERLSGVAHVEVRALATASLNSRPPQLLLDPRVNLAAERRSLRPARWILPLEETAARK